MMNNYEKKNNYYNSFFDGSLTHSWGTDAEAKKKESEYNAWYYQQHKNELNAKRKTSNRVSKEYTEELNYNSKKNPNRLMSGSSNKKSYSNPTGKRTGKVSSEYLAELNYNTTGKSPKKSTPHIQSNKKGKVSSEYEQELAMNSKKNTYKLSRGNAPRTNSSNSRPSSNMSKEYNAEVNANSKKNTYKLSYGHMPGKRSQSTSSRVFTYDEKTGTTKPVSNKVRNTSSKDIGSKLRSAAKSIWGRIKEFSQKAQRGISRGRDAVSKVFNRRKRSSSSGSPNRGATFTLDRKTGRTIRVR